jgi:HEAT repeat protein
VKDKADAKSVVGPLTKMLTDHNDPLRSYAIGTLLELSDLVMPPIPVLIELLDDDAVAGGRLCRLLAKGVPESVPYLTAALNHKRPDVRGQAAMALAYCGPKAKDAVSELTCALHSSDSRLRYAAAHALRNIGPDAKEALVSLRAAFADEEEHIRKMATEAVEAIEKK